MIMIGLSHRGEAQSIVYLRPNDEDLSSTKQLKVPRKSQGSAGRSSSQYKRQDERNMPAIDHSIPTAHIVSYKSYLSPHSLAQKPGLDHLPSLSLAYPTTSPPSSPESPARPFPPPQGSSHTAPKRPTTSPTRHRSSSGSRPSSS